MEISRRDFLKYLGITTAGASLSGLACEAIWSVPDEVYDKIGGAPRLETWRSSVCSLCPGGCGIKVRLIDGIPVRIQGNPLHPVNRGAICPMAEAAIDMLFDPDRLKQPLKRVGQRGENQWQPVSWEEALQSVATRLQGLREQNEAHKLVFVTGSKNSLLDDLFERFMQAFGSPNLFYLEEAHAERLTTYITQGHKSSLGCNFDKTRLLINFGADLLDVGPSPIRFNQVYSELRNRKNGESAKIIHIDSRLSRTASNSSEWIPIRPGTMAALALGMANVLIKDRKYDRAFVRRHGFGFEDWRDGAGHIHKGFRTLVSQEYYPEKVADITGVPAAQVVELARMFGAEEQALVIAGGQAAQSSNALYTLWAIDCLNALKGNYGNDGPFSLQKAPPFARMPKITRDSVAARGLRQKRLSAGAGTFAFADDITGNLAQHLLEKQPYPIDVLMLAGANPLFSSTNQTAFAAALKQIPFVVSFASSMDDTSAYADLILPDHCFLEKQEVFYQVPKTEVRHVGVQQQVIQPFYDTRHTGDVLLQLSDALGGNVASAMAWPDYESYLKARVEGIYKIGAGTIFSERMDEEWLRFLKARGWQIHDYTSFDEFWQVLQEKGGWHDPFPDNTDFTRRFKTPSRKYEFYSRLLHKEMNAVRRANRSQFEDLDALLLRWNITERGDVVFLPHYEPLKYTDHENRFDLHLLSYSLITNINGGSNMRLVQELFGVLVREYWCSWVDINPKTAHRYGIDDGDYVRITSKEGTLVVKAKYHPGVMPDVIHVPFGLGHRNYGRFAKGVGVNPHEIFSEAYDALSGATSVLNTRAMIQKVEEKEMV